MNYHELLAESCDGGVILRFNRLSSQNSLSQDLLIELRDFIEKIRCDETVKILVIRDNQGVYCTGMDFKELTQHMSSNDIKAYLSLYMEILGRLSQLGKFIISVIDGKVSAGGMGFIAISDVVIGTTKSQFNFSEVIWGLMPSMVIPYLVRRIGYQKALKMALCGEVVQYEEAHRIGMIDIVSTSPDEELKKYLIRIGRLQTKTLEQIKHYFSQIQPVSAEMRNAAVHQTFTLLQDKSVTQSIDNFVRYQMFPWDTANMTRERRFSI